MSREPNIDIEIFRKRYMSSFRERRLDRAHRFRIWRNELFGRFTNKGWVETEAEVTFCTARKDRFPFRPNSQPVRLGWGVGFQYSVGGKRFEGEQFSRDRIEIGDRFHIRYNPAHPDQNNSLSSMLDWIDGSIIGAYDVFVVLVLLGLVAAGIILRYR